MHQTMAILMNTLILSQLKQTPQDVMHLIDDGLATTMYLMIYYLNGIKGKPKSPFIFL